jgi:hypothetical protein
MYNLSGINMRTDQLLHFFYITFAVLSRLGGSRLNGRWVFMNLGDFASATLFAIQFVYVIAAFTVCVSAEGSLAVCVNDSVSSSGSMKVKLFCQHTSFFFFFFFQTKVF